MLDGDVPAHEGESPGGAFAIALDDGRLPGPRLTLLAEADTLAATPSTVVAGVLVGLRAPGLLKAAPGAVERARRHSLWVLRTCQPQDARTTLRGA